MNHPDTRKPRVYPVFLPHVGCPFRCIYCNQYLVTGARPSGEILASIKRDLENLANRAKESQKPGEVAFYGGTFASLPILMREDLLRAAARWVKKGIFTGIRFSTRPDTISPEFMEELDRYPVSTVELGVQSLSDDVLRKARRGYLAASVEKALELLRTRSWKVGFQLMVGLPGDGKSHFLYSISETIRLRPDFVRIYPTLVLKETVLEDWYKRGLYKPIDLETAIELCAEAYDMLLKAGIPVIRMGLQASPELEKPTMVVSGPYHPAFGYLVRVRWWQKSIDRLLTMQERKIGSGLRLVVPKRQISEVVGPARRNLEYLKQKWHLSSIEILGADNLSNETFYCETI